MTSSVTFDNARLCDSKAHSLSLIHALVPNISIGAIYEALTTMLFNPYPAQGATYSMPICQVSKLRKKVD